MTKTAVVAEIVAMVILLTLVNWLSTTFLQTKTFWPLMLYSVIYLVARGAFLAVKMRTSSRIR
jgi:hypothetical protein